MLGRYKHLKTRIFLLDVLHIALNAFGGPNMHIALYQKTFVEKRKYLTNKELLELYSLCQMLPGPSSTQTIISIGYKFGGARLALYTALIWITPATVLLALLAFFVGQVSPETLAYLRYILPLAVAFVLVAGVQMASKTLHMKKDYFLAFLAFVSAALLRHPLEEYVKTPWIFPVVLVIAGIISYFIYSPNKEKIPAEKLKVPWHFLWIFIALFVTSAVIGKISANRLFILFENNFRFGTIVFGGGNVLVPMMMEQFVYYNTYMTSQEFITGVGLVQAVPGPIFTIASYTGGLAMRSYGPMQQLVGSVLSSVAIFLPGILLIFFVYPVWRKIKYHPIVVRCLPGVIAASCGLVLAAAYLMFLPVGLNWVLPGNFFYTNLNFLAPINWKMVGFVSLFCFLLFSTKWPSYYYIIGAILLGIVF